MPVDLNLARGAVIIAVGFGAGFVNSIVGSGTLISFPTLVAVGYAERIANITNNVGLVTGSYSAVAAQRRELRGQRARLLRLVPSSAAGATIGALLLFTLPSRYFAHIVPFLILLGVALVLLGPTIQRKVRERATPSDRTGPLPGWLLVCVFLAGIYGGYFGAAQGVILLGFMGAAIDDSLVRINATKNVLAGTVNLIASIVFIVHGGVVWPVVGLLAVGSTVGGVTGSRMGRRIQPNLLRRIVAAVGLVAATRLFLSW